MLKNRILRRPKQKPLIMLATIFIFVLFLLLLHPGLWSRSNIQSLPATTDYREDSWELRDQEGAFLQSVRSGEFLPLESGKQYALTTHLTYDGRLDPIPYGFFHIDHLFCRILLDGQELFRYMPEDVRKWDRAKSAGYIYKALPLPEDCLGMELTVEFIPSLTVPMEYQIPDVVFGDYRSTVHNMVAEDLPHNIVTILCMMLGISALVFSAASLTGSEYREGFNIGNFALLVSLYFMVECRTNYFYIANPYYMYFVNMTMFSLMPVSFMGVMRECMRGTRKKLCTWVIAVEMGIFLVEMLLHLTGILDMREVLPIIHGIGFAEVILVSGLFLSLKDRKQMLSLQLQLTPVMIGMIADAVIYWDHMEIGVSDTTFTTIGVLIFLFRQLVSKMVTQARKLTDMQQHTIEGMATLIESRDGSTGAHVRNTGVYARMIAEEMYRQRMYPREINSEFIDMIGRMAPLHDVGKIKISDTILNKPGKFTSAEYEIMKTHAAMGGKIIGDIMRQDLEPDMLQMAVNIATYHHERWDGRGYPEGRKGLQIPLCARIMAVADVFDALSSKRVYKPEMDIDEVFQEMVRNEGKQFQKEIVEVVVKLRPQLEACLQKNRKSASRKKPSRRRG